MRRSSTTKNLASSGSLLAMPLMEMMLGWDSWPRKRASTARSTMPLVYSVSGRSFRSVLTTYRDMPVLVRTVLERSCRARTSASLSLPASASPRSTRSTRLTTEKPPLPTSLPTRSSG